MQKPDNLTGKDVDSAAGKPGDTPEAARRTGREAIAVGNIRGERRPQPAYKKGIPSRSKISSS
jgi:hypothetical protein